MQSKLDVLLVEDNLADSTLILEVFQDEKIAAAVTVVRDGIAAIQYLKKEHPYEHAVFPDILILDLNMPRMDGREVLKAMKSEPLWESIPVIVLTTSAAEEDVVAAYKLGANSFVTKPVDLEQFIQIVKSIDRFWFNAVRYAPKSSGKRVPSSK